MTNLVHCSYHKCLTVYFSRVARLAAGRSDYKHYKSRLGDFYQQLGDFKIASVNNHALDLSRLGDVRISRFIRDPRDLVVSGYFYHLRGAEQWCEIVDPSIDDLAVVNGTLPSGMQPGQSIATHLESLSLEDGLRAEIEFRTKHWLAMREWPDDDRILVQRYEDIIGNEEASFSSVFSFFELSAPRRALGRLGVRRNTAGRRQADSHVRDPSPEQWRRHFTPGLSEEFDAAYGDILARYRYA